MRVGTGYYGGRDRVLFFTFENKNGRRKTPVTVHFDLDRADANVESNTTKAFAFFESELNAGRPLSRRYRLNDRGEMLPAQ